MNSAKTLLTAGIACLISGHASAELYVETCHGKLGLNHRLHCYVGYSQPDDQEYLQALGAQCKVSFPFEEWGPPTPIQILVTQYPQVVTASLSIGSCPDGNHSWHPKVYLDFVPNSSPYGVDGWYEYPEAGDTNFFFCSN
jgi:hypothetical protein